MAMCRRRRRGKDFHITHSDEAEKKLRAAPHPWQREKEED